MQDIENIRGLEEVSTKSRIRHEDQLTVRLKRNAVGMSVLLYKGTHLVACDYIQSGQSSTTISYELTEYIENLNRAGNKLYKENKRLQRIIKGLKGE